MKAVGLRRKTTLCNRVSFILVPSVFQTDGQALGFLLFFFSLESVVFFCGEETGTGLVSVRPKKKNKISKIVSKSHRIGFRKYSSSFFLSSIFTEQLVCLFVSWLVRAVTGFRLTEFVTFFGFKVFASGTLLAGFASGAKINNKNNKSRRFVFCFLFSKKWRGTFRETTLSRVRSQTQTHTQKK